MESNHHRKFRRLASYPLNDRGILVLQSALYALLNRFTRVYGLLLWLHNASRRPLCLQTAKLILLRPRGSNHRPYAGVVTLSTFVSAYRATGCVRISRCCALHCANGSLANRSN